MPVHGTLLGQSGRAMCPHASGSRAAHADVHVLQFSLSQKRAVSGPAPVQSPCGGFQYTLESAYLGPYRAWPWGCLRGSIWEAEMTSLQMQRPQSSRVGERAAAVTPKPIWTGSSVCSGHVGCSRMVPALLLCSGHVGHTRMAPAVLPTSDGSSRSPDSSKGSP